MHNDLICTDCMSSEACVLWPVGPVAGWVCRAEAFNHKQHHLIFIICKDNASCVLPIYLLTPIQIHWAQCSCSHSTYVLLTPGCSPVECCDASGGKKLMLCRHILLGVMQLMGTELPLNMTLLCYPYGIILPCF